MGEELCRNEDWLNESAMYSACAFNAVEVLRNWSAMLRHWVIPFIPECKETDTEIVRHFTSRCWIQSGSAREKPPVPRYTMTL